MALHTLPVVSRHQSGLKRVFLIEGFAVAACAIRWFICSRAIVVTALANSALFMVKVIRQFVRADVFNHRRNDLAVGQLDRLILVHQNFDVDRFRYICGIVGAGNGLAVFKRAGGRRLCFGLQAAAGGELRRRHRMAVKAGRRPLLALTLKGGMAAGAGSIGLLDLMAPHAALVDVALMHGLLEFYKLALLGAVKGVAVIAGPQIGVMADPARVIVGFMGFMVKGYQVHPGTRV